MITAAVVSLTFMVSINGTNPVPQVLVWDGSLEECEQFGQQAIAHWLGEHPNTVWQGVYRCALEWFGGKA